MTDDPSNRLNKLASLIDTIMYKDMMTLVEELWSKRPAQEFRGAQDIPPMFHVWAIDRQPALVEPPPPIQPLPPALVEPVAEPTDDQGVGTSLEQRVPFAPWKRGMENA